MLLCFIKHQDYLIIKVFHYIFISETKEQPTQKEKPESWKVGKVKVPEYYVREHWERTDTACREAEYIQFNNPLMLIN